MQLWRSGLALGITLLWARAAHAEAPAADDVAAEGHVQGGWVEGRHSGGVALELGGRLRYAWLSGGLNLGGATTILSGLGWVSAVVGPSLRFGSLRVDALAELGLNGYARVGSNFLTDDPGAGAILPFAGGRFSTLLRAFYSERRGVEVWVGPSLQYGEDLLSARRTYTYREDNDGWFGGEPLEQMVTRTVDIGQPRYAATLVLSVSSRL